MKRNRFDPIAQYRENVQNAPKYPCFCLILQLLKMGQGYSRFIDINKYEDRASLNIRQTAIGYIRVVVCQSENIANLPTFKTHLLEIWVLAKIFLANQPIHPDIRFTCIRGSWKIRK